MKRNRVGFFKAKVLGLILMGVFGSWSGTARAQVLLSWDSILDSNGVVVTKNTATTYNLVDGISYEIGYWANTVDLTSKATILGGFTPLGVDYAGTVTEGYFSGANNSAVIPTAWVGLQGSTFGIVFGRSSEIWGAFRFNSYAGGAILANSAPPNSPNQMPGFEIAQITSLGVYLPDELTTGDNPQTGADFIASVSIALPQFGDIDSETAGDQFLIATNAIVLIPEPSTTSLVLLGCAFLLKRRKTNAVLGKNCKNPVLGSQKGGLE